MKTMDRMWPMVAVAAAAMLLGACGDDDGDRDDVTDESSARFDPKTTTIEYVFTDSSVSPEYHRSFTLTVADGRGEVVVDSYGDEIDSDEQEIDSSAVESLLDAYADGDLDAAFGDLEDDDGCTGGRTVALTIEDGDERESTSIYQCADVNEDAAEELMDAVKPLLEAFDIDELTEGRYHG